MPTHATRIRALAASFFVVLAATGASVDDRVHESFASSPTVEVRLENVAGRILVKPWDNSTVDITAVKHASNPDTLANMNVEISKEGAPATWVRVRLRYDHRDPSGGSVDYTARVPRRAQLRVSTVNGAVIADGFANDFTANTVSGDVSAKGTDGNVKVNTVTGLIDVSVTHMSGRRVSLHSVSGAINLAIPRDSGASIKISSLSGKFESDFPLPETSQVVGTSVKGRIGDGSGSIDLETVAGPLILKAAH